MTENILVKLFEHNNWVNLQIINHAIEHREQLKNILSSLGVTSPDIDGWDYGFATNTLVPIADK